MTRKQAKKLSLAIQHFAKGNDLYYYSRVDEKWYKQDIIITSGGVPEIQNIIKDKHFEARKHFSLGGEIEYLAIGNNGNWYPCGGTMQWIDDLEYRPKSKEPVYEVLWYTYVEEGIEKWFLPNDYHLYGKIPEKDWFKFEPSKRIQK